MSVFENTMYTQEIISIEDTAFNDYYFNRENIPVVKGKIINLSEDEKKTLSISYNLVTPFERSRFQISRSCRINADGTFSLDIYYPFPYRIIYINVGKLTRLTVCVKSELFIDLDANKIKQKEGGINYSGKDGKLNIVYNKNNAFKFGKKIRIKREIEELPMNYNFTRKSDSLYQMLCAIDDDFIRHNPSDYSFLIRNDRLSGYYVQLCRRFSNKIPNNLLANTMEHRSLLLSNNGQTIYNQILELFQLKSGWFRRSREVGGLSESKKKENIISNKTIRLINMLDTTFSQSKADFLKMKIVSKDPIEQKIILDILLDNIQTQWCKDILKKEQEKIIELCATINSQIANKTKLENHSNIGKPLCNLAFGAKLYEVNDISAEQLLLNLKTLFKEKSLLIDFWGTWCGGCLADMPYSKQLHDQMKDQPIEFVYLCTSKDSNKDKWQTQICKNELKGTHLFVEYDIMNELMAIFSFSGYPSYAFINSRGEYMPDVINKMRMTTKEELIGIMNK